MKKKVSYSYIALCLIVTAILLFSSSAMAAGEGAITFLGMDGEVMTGQRCGTVSPTAEQVKAVQQDIMGRDAIAIPCIVTVPVAFHILRHNNGVTGDIGDFDILAQLDVLNAAYASTSFQFELHSIERVNNTTWAAMNSTLTEIAVKQALAIDPAHVLNIYTCTDCQGYLGWSYFPNTYPENSYMHGVVALYSSFPGGSSVPYNEGDTVTHEAGHYLGLYHTFQGGCSAPGDQVDDTPYEASPAFGCPVGRDTCSAAGVDPIHNFMDYSDDACMDHFTTGQDDRMDSMIAAYKPSLITCSSSPSPDIKANGSDGPLNVAQGVPLSLTIALDADGSTDNADWWVLGDTPFGWYRYNVGGDTWVPGQAVTYQGAMFDLGSYEVLNMSNLPLGSYTFYFGVDTNMNGSIDMGVLSHDTVDVNIHATSTPSAY